MGFAETGLAPDEQRVVGAGGGFSNRERGCVREPIRSADDKSVEGVAPIQAGAAGGLRVAAVGTLGEVVGPVLMRAVEDLEVFLDVICFGGPVFGRCTGAVVGFIVTDAFGFFFDTPDSTRKVQNLRLNKNVAFVVGGAAKGDERTVQYEGVADEPNGEELERLKEQYFQKFPDGRERVCWPGITYFRVRPRWLRFSDFGATPPEITEYSFE